MYNFVGLLVLLITTQSGLSYVVDKDLGNKKDCFYDAFVRKTSVRNYFRKLPNALQHCWWSSLRLSLPRKRENFIEKRACFHLFVSQGSEVNQCVNSRCPTKVDLVSSSAISKEFQRAFLLCKAINHSGLYLQHFHNHSAASKFMHSICMKITDFKPPRSEKALLIEYKSKPFNGFFWRFLGDFQPGNIKSQCCCIHKKF